MKMIVFWDIAPYSLVEMTDFSVVVASSGRIASPKLFGRLLGLLEPMISPLRGLCLHKTAHTERRTRTYTP
jgi:hypothetical protein